VSVFFLRRVILIFFGCGVCVGVCVCVCLWIGCGVLVLVRGPLRLTLLGSMSGTMVW